MPSKKNRRVSAKISVLMHEGKPQKQAVAMAINMEREHRLGEHGEYHRVHSLDASGTYRRSKPRRPA